MTEERNPLDWYSLTESANSILNGLIAFSSRERRLEMGKINPDRRRIDDLKQLSEEVWAINNNSQNFTNLAQMEEIIHKYGPVLLAERKKNPPTDCSEKSLDELKKRYAQTEQQYKNVFADIVSVYAKTLMPADDPVAIIVGGQPGSGKTELERVARRELEENAVICNLNNLRDFHPDAATIKLHHEPYYPDLTAAYAQSWKNDLIAYGMDNGLNVIMSTTFSSGPDINRIIREWKDKDYGVEIKLMAAHPQLSFLNTQLRFEEMKVREGAARMVSKEVHDDRYYKLISAVSIVNSAALYDKMQIYGRNLAVDGGQVGQV